MGGFISSRRATRVEEVDVSSSNAYRYPPKTGSYFGNYFIMGGNRFESTQPESYLFGENKDVNFLGSKPTPFPYPAPQPNEPTRTLKSLVNIRKDSLKFVKDTEQDTARPVDETPMTNETASTRYNIEFTFDTDVKCAITIYYFASEEMINKQIVYRPQDPGMNSETFHYKRGANQVFSQPTHFIDPTQFPEEQWLYNADKDIAPVVIHCVVEEEDNVGHSHTMLAIVDKSSDGGYTLKAFKQKQFVDGLCYLLQEIYGIENKNTERAKNDDDVDDNGSECVICMSETRDTLILPCRHLCLCNGCADNLRYQANNCPICRAKFRALLQIRAVRKKPSGTLAISRRQMTNVQPETTEETLSNEGIPPGFEAVSLIEALNGPTLPQCALNVPTVLADGTAHARHTANTTNSTSNAKGEAVSGSTACTPNDTPQIKRKQRADLLSIDGGGKDNDCEHLPSSTVATPVLMKKISCPQHIAVTILASTDKVAQENVGTAVRILPEDSAHDSRGQECVENDANEAIEPSDEEMRCSKEDMSSVARSSLYSSVEIVSELSQASTSGSNIKRGCRPADHHGGTDSNSEYKDTESDRNSDGDDGDDDGSSCDNDSNDELRIAMRQAINPLSENVNDQPVHIEEVELQPSSSSARSSYSSQPPGSEPMLALQHPLQHCGGVDSGSTDESSPHSSSSSSKDLLEHQ